MKDHGPCQVELKKKKIEFVNLECYGCGVKIGTKPIDPLYQEEDYDPMLCDRCACLGLQETTNVD